MLYEDISSMENVKKDTLSLFYSEIHLPYLLTSKMLNNFSDLCKNALDTDLSFQGKLEAAKNINVFIANIKNLHNEITDVCTKVDIITNSKKVFPSDTLEEKEKRFLSTKVPIELSLHGSVKATTIDGPFNVNLVKNIVIGENALGDVSSEYITMPTFNALAPYKYGPYVSSAYLASILGGSVSESIIQSVDEETDFVSNNLNDYPYVCRVNVVVPKNSQTHEFIIEDEDSLVSEVSIIKNFYQGFVTKITLYKQKISYQLDSTTKSGAVLKEPISNRFTFVGTYINKGDIVTIGSDTTSVKFRQGNCITTNSPIKSGLGTIECIVRRKWNTFCNRLVNIYSPKNNTADESNKFLRSITLAIKITSNFSLDGYLDARSVFLLKKLRSIHTSRGYNFSLYLLEQCRFLDYYNILEKESTSDQFISSTINKVRTIGV